MSVDIRGKTACASKDNYLFFYHLNKISVINGILSNFCSNN
ncbi:Uncharacterized protein dnm_026520 [Desulfonema magnum]|uniref:Uncharacterized protein n=1 Tax=Desulfonema magnum TaxID=45655 RepID=A0A975BK80_9BACT|nr:Uncharacterized protein dnm_026520 [Desulfonema magnum]